MKYSLSIALLLICSFLKAQHNTVLPNEAKVFLLKGYEVLDYVTGDVNKDGRQDAILILKQPAEDDDSTHMERTRPMVLLLRNNYNKLELKLRNDSLIMCKDCGGMFGDPYQGTTIEKDTTSIYFYGGSRYRWMENYFFVFNKQYKQWELVTHEKGDYDNAHPEKETPASIIPKEELKGITLVNANTVKDPTKTNWRVISKTFFYTSPNLKNRPRKAYLLKDEVIETYDETVNFVFVDYWNKQNEKVTRGYILKKDLQSINQ